MSSKILKSAINKQCSGAVLSEREEDPNYGGVGLSINPSKLKGTIDYLINESSCLVDWCENILAYSSNGRTYVTYILESRKLQNRFVLDVETPSKGIELPSLTSFWPGAEVLEEQLNQQYGIKFATDQAWRKDGTWV